MTWLEIWNEYLNIAPGVEQIALRLACAMVVGIFIGLEREYTHRPAGLRTHIVVALGACVISIAGEMIFAQYSSLGATPDPARLSAQVITGVGFLGAGTIMKEGVNVKGLTTAASVWAVACLGLTAGFGYYSVALLGMVFIFITLTVVEALQHRFIQVGSSSVSYEMETSDISLSLNFLNTIAQEQQVTISDLMSQKTENGHRLNFRIHFVGRRNKKHHVLFFDAVMAHPQTCSLKETDSKTGAAV